MLVSSTPLFSNALGDLGIRHALAQNPKESMDIRISSPNNPPDIHPYQNMEFYLDAQINNFIGNIVTKKEKSILSKTFKVAKPGQVVDTSTTPPTGHFWTWTNLDQHVRLLEGRYPDTSGHVISPQELASGGQPPVGIMLHDTVIPNFSIEALIGAETAKLYDVKPGDVIIVFSDTWGNGPTQLSIRITGTIEPIDVADEYWFMTPYIFTDDSSAGLVVPLFIPEDTMFNVISALFPNIRLTYDWYYYVDQSKISSLKAKNISSSLEALQQNLLRGLPNGIIFTNLASVLKEFLTKQFYTQIPLFLLVFQIVGIILYYVVTVANMVIDREATEMAMLRSRGANTAQVFYILLLEGLLISVVGGIFGPFLGSIVFSLLGKTAPFIPLSGGGLLPVRFSNMVFILAVVSALLCLLAFMLPAIQAVRRGIIQQRQQLARPPRAPFWQRYYLDVIFVIIGAGLYYELRQQGTLAKVDAFGELGIDPLLLVTPILLMIAVAIIFLRLFPLFVKAIEKVGKYFSNSAIIISLRYMARNPVHYTRLILLLIMAASVGTFSASFLGTLNRSYFERTMYFVGADVRQENIRNFTSGKQMACPQ